MSTDSRNDIIAGSARGIAQIIVGHPLDTIKVRLQTQSRLITQGETAKFDSLGGCVKETLSKEGWRGFWKGCTSPLAGCALYSASLFFAYGQSKRIVGIDEKNPRLLDQVLVGGMTGGAAVFIETPIDTIKARLQIQYRNNVPGSTGDVFYKGSFDCFCKVIQQRGLRGLYQGFSATVLRNIPGSMAYFSTYEILKRNGNEYFHPSVSSFIAGGVAGFVFWVTIFPADVVKSCMQTDHLQPSRRVYPTLFSAFSKIYNTLGIRGFWKGFGACALRSFPVNAASFVVYENVRKRLPS